MIDKAKAHLSEAGESYTEHLRFAVLVGCLLLGAGAACILHAIVPAICRRSASRTVGSLVFLFRNRDAVREVARDCSGVLVLVGLLTLAAPFTLLFSMAPVHPGVTIPLSALTFGIVAAYLYSNPELEPVD